MKAFMLLLLTVGLQAAEYSGYLEGRLGSRIYDNAHSDQMTFNQARLQLRAEEELDWASFTLVSDFIADDNIDDDVDLNTGQGPIDLRQANMEFSPVDWADVKIGRQIITWGTGDLIFINDLFPKDYNAFIKGQNIEYLKAPTDSLKTSLFYDDLSLDIVYTPRFNSDRFVDGSEVSFYNQSTGSFTDKDNPINVNKPDRWFKDDEIALRLYTSISGYETALYYYNGFWKSPAGIEASTGDFSFPSLEVYGASTRGVLSKGIANAEIGWYKSDDSAASDPFERNSEFRWLLGYEQEVASELTASVQYYEERKLDYSQYLSSLPSGAYTEDEVRQVMSLRLTQYLFQQDLKLSYIQFHSPSDDDGYIRFGLEYKFSDALICEAGGNIFYGEEEETFYRQFRENSNVYAALRYEF